MREPVRLFNRAGDYSALPSSSYKRYQTYGLSSDVIRFTHTSSGMPISYDQQSVVKGDVTRVIVPSGVTVHFYSDVRGISRIETLEAGTYTLRQPDLIRCIEVFPVPTTMPPAVVPIRPMITSSNVQATPPPSSNSQTTSQTQMTWVQIVVGVMVAIIILLVCVAFYRRYNDTTPWKSVNPHVAIQPKINNIQPPIQQPVMNIAPPGALPVSSMMGSPIVLPKEISPKLPLSFMSSF